MPGGTSGACQQGEQSRRCERTRHPCHIHSSIISEDLIHLQDKLPSGSVKSIPDASGMPASSDRRPASTIPRARRSSVGGRCSMMRPATKTIPIMPRIEIRDRFIGSLPAMASGVSLSSSIPPQAARCTTLGPVTSYVCRAVATHRPHTARGGLHRPYRCPHEATCGIPPADYPVYDGQFIINSIIGPVQGE